jgi:hypothetical protein
MSEPRDDETSPLPADRTAPLPPVAPEPPAAVPDVPSWTSSADATTPAPVPAASAGRTSRALPAAFAPTASGVVGEPSARARWSGRRTAAVVAAALGLGTLGALGATAAFGQSDVREVDGGPGGRPGQLPGQGELPGGLGQRPGGGRGQFPGGPPPGGLDRDGDGGRHDPADRDGDHGGGPGQDGGTGIPGAPGTDDGGSTDPGDANGTTTLTT